MEYAKKRELPVRDLDEQWQLWIDTLSHSRHDWLNDLQLLLGYVQLRKYDKIAECVDMLKQRMTEESRAAKLGHPGLIESLITYKTRITPYVFILRVGQTEELENATSALSAAEWAVRSLLTGFEASASRNEGGGENQLECFIETKTSGITVQFTYQGVYVPSILGDAADALRLERRSLRALRIEEQYEPQEARVIVTIPISN